MALAKDVEPPPPFGMPGAAAPPDAVTEMLAHAVRDEEFRVLGPAVIALGKLHLVFAERLAVGGAGVLLVRRAIADVAVEDDERRPVVGAGEGRERRLELLGVVGVIDVQDVPTVAAEASADVLGEGDVGPAIDRDVVVVVDPAQIRQREMPGERRRLAGDAFHHVAVAAERVDVEVEQGQVRSIEARGEPLAADRRSDAVAAALPERPGRGVDPGGVTEFRMARSAAAELPKVPDVVERHRGAAIGVLDLGKMQQRIEQHRGVAVRQHEAVAVGP